MNLELLWADGPKPATGAIVTAVAHHDRPTVYRVYRRDNGVWQAITTSMDHEQVGAWYLHSAPPAPAPAEVADWLNGQMS